MRRLIVIIIILSGLWGGYWYIGATALETGLKDYLTSKHRATDRIQIAYSDLSVRGFPNRFDTSLTDIHITDAAAGLDWQAPFLYIHALSYKPYHIIAALAHQQTLQIAGQNLQIASDEIKGSVVFVAGALLEKELVIDRSSFVLRNLTISSSIGWEIALNDGNFSTRQTPANPLHYDLSVAINAVTLPDQLRNALDPKRLQPEQISSASLDLTLGFSAPWNLLASRQNAPRLTEMTVNRLAVVWGDVQVIADGDLQIDRDGYPTGTLNLTATNWQKIYQLAEDANAIDPDFAQTIQNGLKVLADMSKGADTINLPLTFANRQMSLGPFPIGPAPRFH